MIRWNNAPLTVSALVLVAIVVVASVIVLAIVQHLISERNDASRRALQNRIAADRRPMQHDRDGRPAARDHHRGEAS